MQKCPAYSPIGALANMGFINSNFVNYTETIPAASKMPIAPFKTFNKQCRYTDLEFKLENVPLRPLMQVAGNRLEIPGLGICLMVSQCHIDLFTGCYFYSFILPMTNFAASHHARNLSAPALQVLLVK